MRHFTSRLRRGDVNDVIYDAEGHEKAAMGALEVQSGFRLGMILIQVSRLLWAWNHKQYQPRYLSILLLYLVTHVKISIQNMATASLQDISVQCLRIFQRANMVWWADMPYNAAASMF